MLREESTQNADYQREMHRHGQLCETTLQRVRGDAGEHAPDLQMLRLQLAELRRQVSVMTQSPGQLADTCDTSRHCVRRSRALIEDAVRTNRALHTQIDHARAIIAESRRLLAGLGHAF